MKYWKSSFKKKKKKKKIGDAVANEHLGKCVKVCLTDIWVTESQSVMETRSGEYGFLIFSSIHEK